MSVKLIPELSLVHFKLFSSKSGQCEVSHLSVEFNLFLLIQIFHFMNVFLRNCLHEVYCIRKFMRVESHFFKHKIIQFVYAAKI